MFAKLYRYDREKVKEFFKRDNRLIIHPIRVRTFRNLVLDQCEAPRSELTFKRESPRTHDSEDEVEVYDEDTSSITSSDDDLMDC